MIAQLRGQVVAKGGMDVVVDCGGVGYAVSVPLSTLDVVANVGQPVTLLTVFVVREDAFSLYGFATEGEREAFKLLTSIQGIGGRIALGILSATSIAEFQRAVLQNNLHALMRLPGIGKKTAERLVVELRDKVIAVPTDGLPLSSGLSQSTQDAIDALQALGYTRVAAEKAVKAVVSSPDYSTTQSSEEIIRLALRMQQ